MTATQSYDPWGTPQGGSGATGFGFAGELQNASSGVLHLRVRWYTTGQARFASVDPFPGVPEQPASQHPYAYAYSNPVRWTDPSGRRVPGLTPECEPIWEIGQGSNWQDFGSYWGTVATTTADIVAAPVMLLYTATTAEGQATIARGAQAIWDDPLDSAQVVWEAQFDPFRDVVRGLACGNEQLIARGLVGTGFTLWGARVLGKTTPGGWLSANEGQIRGRLIGQSDNLGLLGPGGARTRRLIRGVDQIVNGIRTRRITAVLSKKQKKLLREEAFSIYDRVNPGRRSRLGLEIHHRMPLEWAHLFPDADPNRLANLVGLPGRSARTNIHQLVNQQWNTFRANVRSRATPVTAQEVLAFARQVDQTLGLDQYYR